MYGLGKRLLEAVEKDQELDVAFDEILAAPAAQRAVRVDGMNDGPGQEEDDAIALELQRVRLSGDYRYGTLTRWRSAA
jgi:hypothetical protein